MNILKRMFGIREQPVTIDVTPVQDTEIKSLGTIRGLLSGATSSTPPAKVLEIYEKNPDLKRCINIIAASVAVCDPKVYKNGKEVKHDLSSILERPNEAMTGTIFLQTCQKYLDLLGEVYIYTTTTSFGKELYPVSPTNVQHDDGKYHITIGGKEIKDKTYGKDIIRIAIPGLKDPYSESSGYGKTLAHELEISEYAATHQNAYLKNNSRKQMILALPDASPESIEVFSQKLVQNKGPNYSGNVSVTNVSNLSAIALENDWDSEGLISQRRHSSEVIREAFGIPPEVLGNVDNSNRATIESAEYIFQKMVVKPRVDFLIDEINLKVIPMLYPDDEVYAYCKSVVPEDREFRLEVMKANPTAFPVEAWVELAGGNSGEDVSPPSRKRPKSKQIKTSELDGIDMTKLIEELSAGRMNET